jgi:hypothetical protein
LLHVSVRFEVVFQLALAQQFIERLVKPKHTVTKDIPVNHYFLPLAGGVAISMEGSFSLQISANRADLQFHHRQCHHE